MGLGKFGKIGTLWQAVGRLGCPLHGRVAFLIPLGFCLGPHVFHLLLLALTLLLVLALDPQDKDEGDDQDGDTDGENDIPPRRCVVDHPDGTVGASTDGVVVDRRGAIVDAIAVRVSRDHIVGDKKRDPLYRCSGILTQQSPSALRSFAVRHRHVSRLLLDMLTKHTGVIGGSPVCVFAKSVKIINR